MKNLLLTNRGRISRSQYWLAMLIYLGLGAVSGLVLYLLNFLIPGTVGPDGGWSINGVAAIPYVLITFGYIVFCICSGICVNVKRCHDRGRSGWFMFVQLIPVIGGLWYFVETGFLQGTTGPNRFGPDPLDALAPVGPLVASPSPTLSS